MSNPPPERFKTLSLPKPLWRQQRSWKKMWKRRCCMMKKSTGQQKEEPFSENWSWLLDKAEGEK